jgi:hypothetical protein
VIYAIISIFPYEVDTMSLTTTPSGTARANQYRFSIPTEPIPNEPIPTDPPPIPNPLPEPPLEPPYNPDPKPINDPPPHLF